MARSKRLVALALAFLMVFQMLPMSALAEGVWNVGARSNIAEGAAYFDVTFEVEGKTIARQLVQEGTTVTQLPEDPTKAPEADGKTAYRFTGWEANGKAFDTTTPVTGNTSAVAVFAPVSIYRVKIEYIAEGAAAPFQVVERDYMADDKAEVIASPSTYVAQVEGRDTWLYPDQSSVTIDPASLTGDPTIQVWYTSDSVNYTVVHLLQNLNGEGYEEIERETAQGRSGSTVFGTPKDYAFANYDHADAVTIAADGRSVANVYYTRKNFNLNYDSQGGSYIKLQTAPYGTEMNVWSESSSGGDRVLTCKREEHTHTYEDRRWNDGWFGNGYYEYKGGCYRSDRWSISPICGKTEHTHSNSCYTTSPIITNMSPLPVKEGYTFAGWYTDPTFQTKADYNTVLAGDTTVYAKWEAGQANYQVVYFVENANDDNYSYLSSEIRTGTVGQATTLGTRDLNPDWGSLNSAGFGAAQIQQQTITADGKAAVIVRYPRNVYTITFQKSKKTVGTITAKYEAYIGDQWSAIHDEYASGDSWTWLDDNYTSHQEIMPAKDMTCTYNNSNGATHTLTYYIEDPQGDVKDPRGSDKKFTKNHSYQLDFDGSYTYNEEYPPIEGYERYYSTITAWNSGTGNVKTDGRGVPTNPEFYYVRKSYTLTLMNGDTVAAEYTVPYKAPLAEYLAAPAAPVEGAEFTGWYLSPALSNLNTNTTMPQGLILYAGWKLPVYDFTFDVTFSVGDNEVISVEWNNVVNAIEPPARPGYIFDGWYTDETYTEAFDFNKPITAPTTVYAKWIEAPVTYTVSYMRAVTAADGTVTYEPLFPSRTVTKNDQGQNLADGDAVTEEALTDGRYRVDSTSKELTLQRGADNQITFYYYERTAVQYTVRGVLLNSDPEQVLFAENYTSELNLDRVTLPAPYVAGHYATELLGTLEISPDAAQNVLTFYYVPYNQRVFVIEHVDEQGNKLADADTETKIIGDSIQPETFKKDIDGYIFDRIDDENNRNLVATLDMTTTTVQLIYRAIGNLTINKVISGLTDINEVLTFTVTPSADVNTTALAKWAQDNGYTMDNGSLRVTMTANAANANVTLSGLPTGTYTVTEDKVTKETYKVTTAGNGTAVVTAGQTATVTITNTYELDEFTVSYAYEADSAITSVARPEAQKHTVGTTVTVEADLAATGYRFEGWHTADGQVNDADADFTMPNHDVVLLGRFVKDEAQTKDTQYTVKYYRDGEKVEADSYTKTSSVWVNDPAEIAIQETIDTANDKYTGYKLDRTDPVQVPAMGTKVASGTVVQVYYVKDESQTKPTQYTVHYTIEGAEQETDRLTVSGAAWINDDPAQIAIAEGGIPAPAEKYPGYKVDSANPEYPAAGTLVNSNSEYTVNYVKRTDLSYTVKYQTADGKDLLPAKTVKDQTMADTVTETAASIPGYTVDAETKSLTLKATDNEIVFVYTPIDYTVTYELTSNPGNKAVPVDNSKHHVNDTVAVSAEDMDVPGYTFSGWTVKTPADVNIANGTFTMPANDVVLEGSYTANTDTAYTVEFYYQVNGVYPETAETTASRTGTTDTKAAVTDADKTPTKVGYVFDEKAANVLEGTIAGDGSLVLKVYFKQQFTVTYEPGAKGIFAVQKTGGLDYNAATPAFNGTPAGADGYTFTGWAPAVADRVTANATYVAQWTANEHTAYTVEHYQQNLDGNGYTLADTQNLTGITDAAAEYAAKNYPGFTYKNEPEFVSRHEDQDTAVATATILGDGSLVIKLYYDRTSNKVTYSYTGTVPANADPVPAEATYKYGETVTVAPVPAEVPGYTFHGWNVLAEVEGNTFAMPAQDVEITGEWTKNGTIALKLADATETYNGLDQALSLVEVTEDGVKAEEALTFEQVQEQYGIGLTLTKGAGKDVDTYPGEISGETKVTYKENIYDVTYDGGTLTINPAPLTVTTGSAEKPYDGTALTNAEITIDGLVNGETVKGTTTGSQTEPNTSDNTYTIEWGTVKASNYTITDELGTLTVTSTETELTITANTDSKTYNGTALTNAGYKVVFDGQEYTSDAKGKVVLPNGDVLTATVTGSATNVADGKVTNAVASYTITRGTQDVTLSYRNVKTENGTLTITPATLTVTTPDANKVYDGEALTADGTITGFVNNETATFKTTGTQTVVGDSKNTYSITWDGTAKERNYTVAETVGTLTVTEYAEEIIVTTTGGEFTYNGQAYGATVTVSELPKGYTLETATSSATATNVTAEAVAATCDTLVIRNAAGEDVTGKLKITKVDGSIKVNPAKITVYAEDERAYTGADQTLDIGASAKKNVTGVAENETLTLTGATITGNAAGEYTTLDNEGGYTWTVTKADGTTNSASNYTIEVAGKLTITQEGNLSVALADQSYVYNGEAHYLTEATVTSAGGTTTLKYSIDGATWYDSIKDVALSLTNVGEVTIRVQATNPNYSNTAEDSAVLTVTKRPVTITVNDAEKFFAEGDPAFTGTVKGLVNDNDLGTVTYTRTNADEAVGTYNDVLTANYTENANYEVKVENGTFTIKTATADGAELTAQGGIWPYDGDPHTATAAVSGAEGFTIYYKVGEADWTTVAPFVTNVSEGTVTVQVRASKIGYNDLTCEDVTLQITPRPITIIAASDVKVYDGAELSNSQFAVVDGHVEAAPADAVFGADGKALVKNETITATVTGSQTNAGSSANTAADAKVAGDISNYDIRYVNGELTVTKRPVTITAADSSKLFGHDDPSFAPAALTDDTTAEGASEPDCIAALRDALDLAVIRTDKDAADGEAVKVHEQVLTIKAAEDELEAEHTNYTFTIVPANFEIKTNDQDLAVSAEDVEKVYDGNGYGVTAKATVNGTENANVTIRYMDENGAYTLTESPAQTNVGELTVKFEASLEGYQSVTGEAKVTITKRPVTFVGESGERVYNGSEYDLTDVTVDTSRGMALVDGHEANVTASAKGMLPDTYPGTITAANDVRITDVNGQDVTENYAIVTEPGVLTITGITTPVIITAASGTKMYDGTALTNAGFTYTEGVLLEGDELIAVVEGSATNVNDPGVNAVTSYKVMRGDAEVTAAYTFGDSVDGKLTITKRPVTLTSADAEKEYDGTALTNTTVTESQDGQDADGNPTYGFVDGEGAEYSNFSSLTNVDSISNDFTYTLKEGTLPENYAITQVPGTLTVTQNTTALTITSGDYSWVYDGQSHSHPVYTVTYGDGEDAVIVTANEDGTFTLPTGDKLTISGAPVVTNVKGTQDAKGNNTFAYELANANQYATVLTEFGTVTITKRPVFININSDEHVYDGTEKTVTDEDTNQEYTVAVPEQNSGLLAGDTEKLDVVYGTDGAQSKILVGTYDATVSAEGVLILRNADNADVTDNYDVRLNPGTLYINDGTAEEPVEPEYVVTKTHTEKDGGYNLGETVTFTITATNIYDQTKTITLQEIDGVTLAQSVFEDVPAGETISTTATYTITEADILAGEFVNTVTVAFDVKSFQNTDTVTTADPNGHLTVTKETTSTPANGETYALGETITYGITVTNDGNVTIRNIVVVDTVEGYEAVTLNEGEDAFELAPGASQTIEYAHVVTEQDILVGSVVNNATAYGTTPPDVPTPGVEPGDTEDPTEDPNPSFTLEKTLTNLPEKGYFTLGEEAAFDIAVTNNGNVTLSGIDVREQLEGAVILEGEGYIVRDNVATIETLPVGETVTVKAVYTITEADLGAELVNTVTGTGSGPEDHDPEDPTPGEEEIPTDDVMTVTGIKTWNDAGNAYLTRPDTIMVNLLADGVEIAEQLVTADLGWVYTFTTLPIHNADGTEIVYTVTEDAVAGYDATYTEDGIVNSLQTYGVTVNYWLNSIGGTPAAESFYGTYQYGQTYNIASPAVLGYNANQERVIGTVLGDVVIDVIYTPAAFTIAVHYVYQDGTEALATYRDTLLFGEGFYVATPALAGYTPNIRLVAGNMEARHMSYTVIYAPEDVVITIDEYGVPLGLGNMVMNVGDCIE